MALTEGFNPEVVTTSIGDVKAAYEELISVLITNTQNNFINKMSDKWASQYAVDFFNDAFKPTIESLIYGGGEAGNGINAVFESVVLSMDSAGKAWASRSGSDSIYTATTFEATSSRLDVSSIVENIAGVRGIDKENINDVIATLATIASDAAAALSSAKSAVENCGFVGDNQAENLQGSLGTIKTNIDSAISGLTDTFKNAMDNTVAAHGETGTQVAQAFAGEAA